MHAYILSDRQTGRLTVTDRQTDRLLLLIIIIIIIRIVIIIIIERFNVA